MPDTAEISSGNILLCFCFFCHVPKTKALSRHLHVCETRESSTQRTFFKIDHPHPPPHPPQKKMKKNGLTKKKGT